MTIYRGDGGGYVVFAGDEDEDEGEGKSEDDLAAAAPPAGGAGAGAGGAAAGPGGIGVPGLALHRLAGLLEALLVVPGTAQDQFTAGYNAPQAPTPARAPGVRGGGGMRVPPGV